METYLEKAQKVKNETKEALEIILGALNHGQREKLYGNVEVMRLLMRYGVETDG